MTPVLEATAVRLLPYGPEHDAQTVAWLNDERMQRSFGLSRTITLASHRAWIVANKDVLIWAISGEADEHFGNILLQPVHSRRSAYLQIYLGNPDARGKGVGWKALACVLDFSFGSLGLHRVWLHTLSDNRLAAALYEKAGFVREGIERGALPRDGSFVDQWRWSILSHEWKPGTAGSR